METQCNAPQDVPSVDRGGYRERESEWVFVGAEGGEGGDGALGKQMEKVDTSVIREWGTGVARNRIQQSFLPLS